MYIQDIVKDIFIHPAVKSGFYKFHATKSFLYNYISYWKMGQYLLLYNLAKFRNAAAISLLSNNLEITCYKEAFSYWTFSFELTVGTGE